MVGHSLTCYRMERIHCYSPLAQLQGGTWHDEGIFSISRKLATLLYYGADPRYRGLHRWSCLHLCVRSQSHYKNIAPTTVRSLVLCSRILIDGGADVYAADSLGYSVTEAAHTNFVPENCGSPLGKSVGFDVNEVYNLDRNRRCKRSDDPYAPSNDHLRMRGESYG